MFDDDDDDDPLTHLNARTSHRVRRRDRALTKRRCPKPEGHASRDAPTEGALVIEIGLGAATVVTAADELLRCVVDPRLRQRQALCVGDDVVVARDPSGTDVVVRAGPRRTVLTRRDPHHRHRAQMIVANVDVIVIVASATDPPFRPGLVDRYLVAVHRGGAKPLLVINKVDTADRVARDALAAEVAPYQGIEVPVHWVSASTGEGLDALLDALAGQRCAFVGHSGVGKSSLVTALGSSAVVGELAEHGRGRHTTSTSTLHRLRGGTEVIDTPGVRQLGFLELTGRELRDAFPELQARAAECGFADCNHVHEEDCAVIAAVERGELPASRYQGYLRILAQTES